MAFSSVLALFLVLLVQEFGAVAHLQEPSKLYRVARVSPMGSFPYSLAYMRMMRPAPSSIRPIASYQWLNRAEADQDLSDLIDSLDEGHLPPPKQSSQDRERRSTGYACRFKFCRIFDA